MSSVVVIGSQWGDEGKGKIVDYLAQQADAVVRYSGGSNAGHTVVVNDVSYKLRLLPSGILYKDKTCILGNGVVINPRVVLQEIAEMKAKGVDTSNLLISDRAHVVFPYHEKQDELQEAALGDAKIGTTKGGIGPCYMDKYARTGIRVCDLMNKDVLAAKLKRNLDAKNALFTKVYGAEPLAYEPMLKAYTTRVGEGPFVCELFDTDGPGTYLRNTGHEFGTVTGRPRRCGWLDAFMVKYAARLNSMDALAITRLDILDGMDEIKMCTGWTIDGEPIQHIPADLTILAKAKPVYETFKGWKKDISGVRSYSDLPAEAQAYLNRLSEVVGVEIGIVSVGPNRDQTFSLKEFF